MARDMIGGVPVFEAVTEDIAVSVQSFFLPDQSSPEEDRYIWAYRICIQNDSDRIVQLLTRRWEITDATGYTEVVEGDGVVGEQPVLRPGDHHIYSSGTPLATPTGFMVGHYGMKDLSGDGAGRTYSIAIPAFSLDSPFHQASVN